MDNCETDAEVMTAVSLLRQMTPEQRAVVREHLSRMPNHKFVVDPFRAEALFRILRQITGAGENRGCRSARCVWYRTMVAYQMIGEGYSTTQIGRQIGKDHSTIVHYRQKMDDALSMPRAYQDIIPVWEEFKKRIEL